MFWMVMGVLFAVYGLLLGLLVWAAVVVAKRRGANTGVWRWRALCYVLAMSVSIVAWRWFVNPLPSDEYMIEHFNKNRAAYEELVAGYIDANSKGKDAMQAWLDEPRTIELQRVVMDKEELVVTKSSQVYRGIGVNYGSGKNRTINSINFSIANGSASSLLHRGVVWKEYIYYVKAPELTDDGFCRKKNGKAEKCLNKSNTGILRSLDGYPAFSDADAGCGDYMRQIDANWFLRYVKGCS